MVTIQALMLWSHGCAIQSKQSKISNNLLDASFLPINFDSVYIRFDQTVSNSKNVKLMIVLHEQNCVLINLTAFQINHIMRLHS